MKNGNKKSKTDTIKQRAIYVYLPSEEMADRWKETAKKQKASISKFVIEHVENSIIKNDETMTFQKRMELIKENTDLKADYLALSKRYRILNTAMERLEDELKQYRTQPFIQKDFTGIRNYEKDLINLFKEKKEIRKEDLNNYLNIKSNNTDIIEAVNKQIENLEEYGLIKDLGGKWLWRP